MAGRLTLTQQIVVRLNARELDRGSTNGRSAAFEAARAGSTPAPRTLWWPWCSGSAHDAVNVGVPDRYRVATPTGCRVMVTHLPWEQVHAGSIPAIPTISTGCALGCRDALQATRGGFDSLTVHEGREAGLNPCSAAKLRPVAQWTEHSPLCTGAPGRARCLQNSSRGFESFPVRGECGAMAPNQS